ncbi:MAG: threonine/serine exporter [Ruminococcaceae bacterium]|nr:threonine/serine exporter [Oscillospiraceae bacterium]
MKEALIQIFTGALGSLCFAVLFNIRGKRLLFTALGGTLSWSLFLFLEQFIKSEALNYFLVAAALSVYAEFLARRLKTPTTTFITTTLIPLIPGGSLYYTMAYAFHGESERFLEKGIYTLELSAALALGIIAAAGFTKLFFASFKSEKK